MHFLWVDCLSSTPADSKSLKCKRRNQPNNYHLMSTLCRPRVHSVSYFSISLYERGSRLEQWGIRVNYIRSPHLLPCIAQNQFPSTFQIQGWEQLHSFSYTFNPNQSLFRLFQQSAKFVFVNGYVESNLQGDGLLNRFCLSSCDFCCFATWVILLFCRLSSSLNLNPTHNSKVWAWMRKSAAVWIKCISGLCPRKKHFALKSFHPWPRLSKIHIFAENDMDSHFWLPFGFH